VASARSRFAMVAWKGTIWKFITAIASAAARTGSVA
jgi:hypothetical protein